MAELRAGIRRVRVIVREAKQAIGQARPDGAVLPANPDEEGPIIPAD